MADVKISGLPASTTPLAGTEVLPIVQGGQTRQVSVANLTAGRAVSASNLTLTGVATVPAGTAAAPSITTTGDTNTGIFFPAADTVAVATNSVEAVRIDSSGNLGLGVTPSAWGSSFKALQFGLSGAIANNSGGDNYFVANGRFDGANFRYLINAEANYYAQENGAHQWLNAPAGTAGNVITFTERMRLHASGGVSIGNITDPGATNLNVAGTIVSGSNISGTNISGTGSLIWGSAGSYVAGSIYADPNWGAIFRAKTASPVSAIFMWVNSTEVECMRITTANNLKTAGTISPQQATTAAAPAYVKGAIYFDTTLNKLRVGGATAWETITSV